ncbi:MAG TPA: DUF2252 domain-containing protein [Gaiellaceae bacterium]|nr:DUF2252 domain-containing protein [Gaiellaceae bacterium]
MAESTARASRNRHLTVDERIARGRDERAAVPRSSHGSWEPAADRSDPIALLEEQAASRVPALVPIRYGRMLESPLAFYRGAALIMAADLAATPHSEINVQLCGDAHLSNFGVFGSPERKLMFDINDFDETLPGPWEWDVKRLAASVEIVGRALGFSPSDRRDAVTACVADYRGQMRTSAEMSTLDVWYDHMDAEMIKDWLNGEVSAKRLGKREARESAEDLEKARERDHHRVFRKRTGEVDGELRIVADPPLIVPIEDLTEPGTTPAQIDLSMRKLIVSYRRTLARYHHPIEEFEYVHAAHKVVGVGSVGTRAWILLMVGRDEDDPLFLQAKEAQASVLERFVGVSEHANHGQRVVVGQRLMQAASDIFLGWVRVRDLDGRPRDYYVRQLHDWKGGVDVETMRPAGATVYGRLCGATLARAHARWGDRLAIASYLGKGDAFDEAIADFSAAYADQNERDYESFVRAVESGRLEAQTSL